MMRRLLVTAGVIMLLPAAGARAAGPTLTESTTSGFPNRTYLLTLPEKRALAPEDVTVKENGTAVEDVQVVAGGRTATVLAIDASATMRGRAIIDAMAAAREFAARRRPDQALGVVFFSREHGVALNPTTDAAEIDRVLSEVPPVGGANIQDAASVALEALRDFRADVASIVILSDGTDLSGKVDSLIAPQAVVPIARRANVRLFTVGLRSPNFDAGVLRTLAQAGGEYAEARSSRDLAAIFSSLGDRLSSEYQIKYQSPSPLSSKVAVSVAVKGVAGEATLAYSSPAFPIGAGVPASQRSMWQSTAAAVAVAALVSILLGIALVILLRPVPRTLRQRISLFAPDHPGGIVLRMREVAAIPVLASADRMLARSKRWEDFKLDVELAKLKFSAIQILLGTLVLTLGLTALFGVALGNLVMAILAAVALPVTARASVGYKARKVRRAFEEQLPDNLQVLASALRAGHSFIGALNMMVADAPEPSRTEYGRVMQDEQLGVPIEDSLKVVSERMRCEDVIYIGLIATLQQETGGNTAEVLDKVVETMRERAKLRRLVRILTVQGRMGGWIVTALPILMVIFLNLVRPDYMTPMTEKTIGIVMLVAAALAVALGAHAIRKIVDIKV